MFTSLRFRLPAFFLAGVALAGIVSTAIAVQLFQDHIRSQSLAELKREAKRKLASQERPSGHDKPGGGTRWTRFARGAAWLSTRS